MRGFKNNFIFIFFKIISSAAVFLCRLWRPGEDDLVVPQSMAILRYLGKKWGKNGNSLQEFGKNNSLIEYARELITSIYDSHLSDDSPIPMEAVAKLTKHYDVVQKLLNKDGKFSSEI